MKYYLLMIFAALFFITACEKVEIPQSKEDILREGRWQAKEIWRKVRVDDTTFKVDTIRISAMAECKHDDYLDFLDNHNGVLESNEKKCQGEIDEIDFRWGLSEKDTKMYIYDAGDMFDGNNDISADLISFSESSLKLEYISVGNSIETQNNEPTVVVDTVWYTAMIEKF